MKIRTNTLTGTALDWAVASIEKLPADLLTWHDGEPVVQRSLLGHTHLLRCEFSTSWAQGGPIIERESISVWARGNEWAAESFVPNQQGIECVGPTPLIAAMRCYVASCLGDEIDVPEELK